jgi:hypothetical protein
MSFLSGFRWHTAVLKRNALRSRDELKNRVHLPLSLLDTLTLISWDIWILPSEQDARHYQHVACRYGRTPS